MKTKEDSPFVWWNNLPEHIKEYIFNNYSNVEGVHRQTYEYLDQYDILTIWNDIKKYM